MIDEEARESIALEKQVLVAPVLLPFEDGEVGLTVLEKLELDATTVFAVLLLSIEAEEIMLLPAVDAVSEVKTELERIAELEVEFMVPVADAMKEEAVLLSAKEDIEVVTVAVTIDVIEGVAVVPSAGEIKEELAFIDVGSELVTGVAVVTLDVVAEESLFVRVTTEEAMEDSGIEDESKVLVESLVAESVVSAVDDVDIILVSLEAREVRIPVSLLIASDIVEDVEESRDVDVLDVFATILDPK